MYLVEHGESRATVARVLGIHPKTLARWLRLARQPGGLDRRPGRGPRPGLSDDQLRQLGQLLGQGPRAHGWPTQGWTVGRVARLIEREFGVRYHPEHVRKILKRRLRRTPRARRRGDGERSGC